MKTLFHTSAAVTAILIAAPAFAQSGPPGDCYLCSYESAVIDATQGGNGNKATITQKGADDQNIVMKQLGNAGDIYIDQRGAAALIDAEQTAGASGAVTRITQRENRTSDEVHLKQAGSGRLQVYQANGDGMIGAGQYATADVSGQNIDASIQQYGTAQNADLRMANVSGGGTMIAQGGFANRVSLVQENVSNSVDLAFQGSWGATGADPARFHDSEVQSSYQSGANQHLFGDQHADGAAMSLTQLGDNSRISAYQDWYQGLASDQQMTIMQNGSGLTTLATQFGTGLVADISQGGVNNTLELHQGGTNVKANLVQVGSNNTMTVHQHD